MSGADLLRRCGAALYGERWHSPLARDLGVAARTVERWDAGQRATPPGVWPELYRLLGARGAEMATLRQELADELRGDMDPADD